VVTAYSVAPFITTRLQFLSSERFLRETLQTFFLTHRENNPMRGVCFSEIY